MSTDEEPPAGPHTSFAARLRVVVDASYNARTQKPYTPRDIADGTGLSPTYVRLLLRGGVAMPSADKVQSLARFLGVAVEDLTGTPPVSRVPQPDIDAALQRALSDPRIKDMALRAAALGNREKTVLLQMVNNLLDLLPHSSPAQTSHPMLPERGDARPDDRPG